VARINRATGSPLTPWATVLHTDNVTGNAIRARANIGNYHLSGAYGGVSLHRMSNEGGGVSDVFRCGHVPKRELAEKMWAFLAGYEAATENAG